MEKISELSVILNYISTFIALLFLIYVLIIILYNKKKYATYLPLFISSFLLLIIYIIRIILNFYGLGIFLILIWTFQTIYWYGSYKKQKINRTIYNFIFKKDE